MCYIQYCFFAFWWRCWWHVGEVVINQTNYQECQFDVHCIHCQTSTDILGIVNEFAQYVQNYFQYVYKPFNSQLVIKKSVEDHDKKPKYQRNFYVWTVTFKWISVFQSWLDCFSIGVLAFIQNINFLSSVVFAYWCPFVTIFKCCNL